MQLDFETSEVLPVGVRKEAQAGVQKILSQQLTEADTLHFDVIT